MKMPETIDVNINRLKLESQYTAEIKLTGLKWFSVRIKLAAYLLWLAAYLGNPLIEIREK